MLDRPSKMRDDVIIPNFHRDRVEQGHYLTFIPNDPQYSQYRLVFETDAKVVTNYRAGKLPEVEWVERCG